MIPADQPANRVFLPDPRRHHSRRKYELPVDVARRPHSQVGRRARHESIGKTGDVFSVDLRHGKGHPPSILDAVADLSDVQPVKVREARDHVDDPGAPDGVHLRRVGRVLNADPFRQDTLFLCLLEGIHLHTAAVREEERAAVVVLGQNLVERPVDIHVFGILFRVRAEVVDEGVDLHVAHAKAETVRSLLPHLHRRTRGGSYVCIARSVHHHLREDRLPPRLALDDDSAQRSILDDSAGHDNVEKDFGTLLGSQFRQHQFPLLDVVDDMALVLAPLPAVPGRFGQGVRHLHGVARGRQLPLRREEAVEDRTAHARRGHAPEKGVAFDEQRLRPGPGSGHSRRNSSQSSAADQHVHLGAHGRFPRCFDDHSVFRLHLIIPSTPDDSRFSWNLALKTGKITCPCASGLPGSSWTRRNPDLPVHPPQPRTTPDGGWYRTARRSAPSPHHLHR